jgi:hypothetical protein
MTLSSRAFRVQKLSARARLEFGGYQKFKEECREAQGTHFLEALIQDLRFGGFLTRYL